MDAIRRTTAYYWLLLCSCEHGELPGERSCFIYTESTLLYVTFPSQSNPRRNLGPDKFTRYKEQIQFNSGSAQISKCKQIQINAVKNDA